ncbi:MAG: helix-turn-helix transcriptional regulator [Fimbriimonadaceae bacterium]|nr:helix-turn-helix transcriptional regulator [Fimbriimonadaceae bacterium]
MARSASGVLSVAPGVNVLGINAEGAIIARSAQASRIVIVPPQSIFYIKGPVRLSALVARGEHCLNLLSWSSTSMPILDHWTSSYGQNRSSKGQIRNVGCKPINPNFVASMSRFDEAKSSPSELMEPLLLSVIWECVARIMVGGDEMQLSPIPFDLPEPLLKLAEAVRRNPSGTWSLKEASDMARYSPFHFSRVFKQLVGYGFHEYVDRCRTELAVEMLVSNDSPVDLVANLAGFGTTQALRESIREYLGLVPSEFRSLPEVYEPIPS